MDNLLKYVTSFVMLQLFLPFLLFHCDVGNAKPKQTIPHRYRRQDQFDYEQPPDDTVVNGPDQKENQFSTGLKPVITTRMRTTPSLITLDNDCDYIPTNCLHIHETGKLCARTVYYRYETMQNYCMLDFVNCMEGYDIWQVVYMGECFNVTAIEEYIDYPYHDDFFLDQYYILNDH